MNSYIRPRGILVWKMPSEVSGPDSYALLVHPTKSEARMVHTEGVAYLVTPEKPWTWNDYDPECPSFTYTELLDLIPSLEIAPTDLACGDRCSTSATARVRACSPTTTRTSCSVRCRGARGA